MYLTAHRVRQIKGEKAKVGINAFLHRHRESELPEDTRFDEVDIVDQIANNNTGKLVAESVDLVPGGSSVLSFIDIVGVEELDKERIQEFSTLWNRISKRFTTRLPRLRQTWPLNLVSRMVCRDKKQESIGHLQNEPCVCSSRRSLLSGVLKTRG